MVLWEVTSAVPHGVVGSGHILVVLFFFHSVEHTFDVLTQDCTLKALGPLLTYIFTTSKSRHRFKFKVLKFWMTV